MAGAAAGMPKVVQVLDVINSDVDEPDLRLGITEDGDIVFGVREAVQRARGVQKSKACQALAGKASENLARALGIAGGIFDTARWPGSVNAQSTCEVQHLAKVLDWALENYHGAKGLTVDKRVALVADVRAKLVPHAQQRISGVRGRMAASMGLDIGQVDQDLAVLRGDLESAKARAQVATTQLQQAHAELSSLVDVESIAARVEENGHVGFDIKVRSGIGEGVMLWEQQAAGTTKAVDSSVATKKRKKNVWVAAVDWTFGSIIKTRSVWRLLFTALRYATFAFLESHGNKIAPLVSSLSSQDGYPEKGAPVADGTVAGQGLKRGVETLASHALQIPAYLRDIDDAKTACDAQLCALHQRHAAHGTTVTAEEERDIVTRMVLTDGARRRRSFEEACATVAATVTSVSAAALGVGEESEDENEMGPEEEPLGAMRSEGATDLGD